MNYRVCLGPGAGFVAMATIMSSVILGPGPLRSLRIVGAVIGLVSLPLAFLPFFTLRNRGEPEAGGSYMDTTRVVDSGLYSIVRHPQYLGYILFMATFSLLAQRMLVTCLAILAVALMYLSAAAEESECSERLGEPYREYLRRVPRFNILAGVFRRLRRGARG